MGRLPASFRKKCEAIAADWRVRVGLRSFDKMPANLLAKAFEADIRSLADFLGLSATMIAKLPDVDLDAFIYSRDPLVIYYNPHREPERYESTMMHELAHVILEHPPEKLEVVDGVLQRNPDKRVEEEAGFLGGCLQIPRGGILWARQKGISKEEVGAHFGASKEMVQWRWNAVK